MKLTEEQYKQAARYVDGEMESSEKEAFEAELLNNSSLLEEVEAYKEIRLLGESVEGKINTLDPLLVEKKSANEEVWRMLQQARAEWEQHHEADLKGPPDLTIPNAREKAHRNLRGMNLGKWLIAALVLGVTSLCALLWYHQGEKKESKVAIDQKERDVKGITKNKKQETSIGALNEDTTTSPKMSTPSSNTTLPPRKDEQNKEKKARASMETLVRSYFAPDSLPFEVPNALGVASAYYKDQKHEKAIKEYKRIIDASKNNREDLDITTRSKKTEKELTSFYAHYYLGQSNLALNHVQPAIRELESAIEESPSVYWKSKAQWYLALAYLKAGHMQRTKGLLEQVKQNDPSGVYRQKAIQVKRKLKKQ